MDKKAYEPGISILHIACAPREDSDQPAQASHRFCCAPKMH